VLGLSPFRAGLWTTPFGGAFIIGSMLTPLLARRMRPSFVIAGGLALSAVGFGALTQVSGASALAVLVTGFVIYALGIAPVTTLATDLIIGSAPPQRAGAASAISETGAELGGALGIAILGSIGASVYRGAMAGAVPTGIAPEAMAAARDTLGGASAVAARLPPELGAELLRAARAAFTQAMESTAMISAVLVLAMALVVVLVLRRDDTGAEVKP
jgi:DHA2 family multidrug resistance protein-like MFS transporter